MKKIILLAITTAILVSTVFSQEKVKTVKACNINGYVLDKDTNGLNVRAVPDKSGKILSSLIKGEEEIGLDIVGTAGNGWVKIANAWGGAAGDDIFKGSGWVFATMLATSAKGSPNYDSPANLYLSANKRSKVLKRIPSEKELQFLDCSGGWAKVSYQGKSGWLAPENQCGNPVTTCN